MNLGLAMNRESLAAVSGVLIGLWVLAAVVFHSRILPLDRAAGRHVGVVDPLDVGAVLVTATLMVFVGLEVSSPARVVLALAFITFVPGWAALGLVPPLKLVSLSAAVVARVPLVEGIAKVAMAVALSLTLCTAAAQALVWLELWNPPVLFGVLGGLSLVAFAVRAVWPRPFSPLQLDVR